ncbi:MAG: hypothetical protein HY925_12950 [Elusimicrobia bacterium]|nr:hypothetical protein [Elusimicrobiota bacterium]
MNNLRAAVLLALLMLPSAPAFAASSDADWLTETRNRLEDWQKRLSPLLRAGLEKLGDEEYASPMKTRSWGKPPPLTVFLDEGLYVVFHVPGWNAQTPTIVPEADLRRAGFIPVPSDLFQLEEYGAKVLLDAKAMQGADSKDPVKYMARAQDALVSPVLLIKWVQALTNERLDKIRAAELVKHVQPPAFQ